MTNSLTPVPLSTWLTPMEPMPRLEILAQQPDVRTVITAVGSGGTMAGLVTALGPARVLGVSVGTVLT